MSGQWTERALCLKELVPESWYPVAAPRSRAYYKLSAAARQVCQRCPVKAECLEEALYGVGRHDDHGIWGGLDPEERSRLRHPVSRLTRKGH